MFLDIPYAYRAEVRGYRKMNTVKATFMGSVLVRIPDADPEAAPLAMTAETADRRRHDYRELHGRLVRSLWVPTARGMVAVTAGNACEAMKEFAEHARVADVGARWPGGKPPDGTREVTDAAAWQEIRGTTQAECARAAQAFWEGAAFVGGSLLVPSSGPAWTVRVEVIVNGEPYTGPAALRPNGWEHRPCLSLCEERGNLNQPNARWVFPPSALAEAEVRLAAVRSNMDLQLYGAYGSWNPVPGPTEGSVSGPALTALETVGLPHREIALAAAGLLDAAAADLRKMEPDAVRAYADLSEADRSGIGPESAADALAALSRFHGMWKSGTVGERVDPAAPLLARLARPGADGPGAVPALRR